MGSSLSQQLCCALCERCREQQAADAEPSETKPILQSPREPGPPLDSQLPTPALRVPGQGSKGLLQERQPAAGALEENGEPCSAAEGWEAAWNPMDFFVVPADEEVEEAEGLTQQEKGGKAEEGAKPGAAVPAGGTAVGAEQEQPGREGAPCAGRTLQEGEILRLIEFLSRAEPGQGCEAEPAAHPPGALMDRGSSPCAAGLPGQPEPWLGAEPVQGTARAEAAQPSPQPAQRAELSCLAQAVSLLSLQSPSQVVARGVAELYSTSAVSWEPLCPQWGSLEPPGQLLELLEQEQGSLAPALAVGSLCCAGLAGLSEVLQQPQDGALWELGQERSRECTPGPEAEPRHRIMQPAVELPEEPATSLAAPGKQEAEFPRVPPSLPEVLGSSGEREAGNVEA